MKFTNLPWFTRKEIINSIIEDLPIYCLLSREWLIETAKRHGETLMYPGRPGGDFRNPWYAIYFGKILFGRMDTINWELIYRQKSLYGIVLNIEPNDSKEECEEFVDKMLPLPFLKSVTANFESDHNHFKLTRLFLGQNKIEKLNITLENLNQLLNSNTLMFPCLMDLTINDMNHTFDINKLLEITPKLKILKLDSYEQKDILVHLLDQFNPTIKELNIQYFQLDKIIKLNLSKWPNLRNLESNYSIQFTDLNHFTNVEDLTLKGSSEYISSVVSAKFPKLRNLFLHINDAPDKDSIHDILNCVLQSSN